MNALWESGVIEAGREQVTVQAVGGMVKVDQTSGERATSYRLTPRQAIAAANANFAIAEALVNAANRVQQAIDAAQLRAEGTDA